MNKSTEQAMREHIKYLLELCVQSSLNCVNEGSKSLKQHEKDCKDLEFYVQLLDKEGSMKNLPSKYLELALGKFKLLLDICKDL